MVGSALSPHHYATALLTVMNDHDLMYIASNDDEHQYTYSRSIQDAPYVYSFINVFTESSVYLSKAAAC